MSNDNSKTKVALITGGARRIGAAISRELHRYGCKILIHYHRSQDDAERLTTELNSIRANSCHIIKADLCDHRSLEQLVSSATQHWNRLDFLVNNASAFYPTPLGDITEQQWQDLFATNVKAPLFLAQAAIEPLQKSHGCIINILDIYAARPLLQHSVYSASKSALTSVTQSLARELAPAIRVNGVAPGAILWPEQEVSEGAKQSILKRIPLQRTGEADDIAKTARFLALEAPYITGQIISVDGGRSLNI